MKLAVIGAGVAGLAATRRGIEFGCEVTVFEQTDKVGGTWNYTPDIGKDKYGLDIHTSMYKGLYTNLPKELMGYPDFPFPEQEKSFISQEDVLAYYNLFAEEFDLKKYMKFEHHVIRVRPLKDETWEITIKNLPLDTCDILIFDAVLVCNGHYNTPFTAKIPGQDIFIGKQLHSNDYREPRPFTGESVLVIGAGPSGIDLVHTLSKVAERVTFSHHLEKKLETKFNSNLDQKPDVQYFTETGAVFVDGSESSYSTILYCTGYKYSYPFLSVDCGVSSDNNYVRPLFKHCLSINHPTLGFLGLTSYNCVSQVVDLQSRFCLTFMIGRKALPSKKEMLDDTEREMNERWSCGFKTHHAHNMGPRQAKYFVSLAETADLVPIKPVFPKMHVEATTTLRNDIVNFRFNKFHVIDDENFVISKLSEQDHTF